MRLLAKAGRFLHYYRQKRRALARARRRGLPGLDFHAWGEGLGWRLLLKNFSAASDLLLAPVNTFRYWEFPFAWKHLPARLDHCLDLSSPRLFSLFVHEHAAAGSITLLNPDQSDLMQTLAISKCLGFDRIECRAEGVEWLADIRERYDCVWSISVVEHVAGTCTDTQAVRWLYQAVRPGGRLILTVPVDRHFHDEYRNYDAYGTQNSVDGRYFFQHVYDLAALQERLCAPIEVPPRALEWYGEKIPGLFKECEQRWLREGRDFVVQDPLIMSESFQQFPGWEAMPGFGVCGLVFEKPLDRGR